MRRKIRPKVVWLPLDINNRLGVPAGPASSGSDSSVGINFLPTPPGPVVPFVQRAFPVVNDIPLNIASNANSLADLEGSAYRLRRIVGKIVVAFDEKVTQPTTQVTAAIVTAGFIVLRVDPAGVPLQGGAAGPYNPAILDSTRDPWIWRRSWCISNVAGSLADNRAITFPQSNVGGYGSGNMDGPHVDAKTARVVSDEERLFLCFSVDALDGGGTQQQDEGSVLLIWELRVLATMRKMSGNRRNASR